MIVKAAAVITALTVIGGVAWEGHALKQEVAASVMSNGSNGVTPASGFRSSRYARRDKPS